MQIFQLAVIISALSALGLAAPAPTYSELEARGCVDKRDPDKRVTGSCGVYKREIDAIMPEEEELVARGCVDKRDPDKRVTGSCGVYKRDIDATMPEEEELVARGYVDKRDPDKRVTGSCGVYKRGSYSKFAGVPEINVDAE